eukprot:Opistho-2@44147
MVAGKVPSGDRLAQLRTLMREHGLAAYLVPPEDAHQSEYLAEQDKRRAFISGFTGSAGAAIVTLDKAALWTDGRYFLQAEMQLDDNWQLMRMGTPDTPSQPEWLVRVLAEGSVIGVDPFLVPASKFRQLEKHLRREGRMSLVAVNRNLVDAVWGGLRPGAPSGLIFPLPLENTGKSHSQKLTELRAAMAGGGKNPRCDALVVSALDDVAWLFNLRGSDVEYTPVFIAYAIVTCDSAALYVDSSKLDTAALVHLRGGDAGPMHVRPYSAVAEDLAALASAAQHKIWLGPKCSEGLAQLVPKNKILESPLPTVLSKALKTGAELNGMRNSHIRDAAALCAFFAWMESEMAHPDRTHTEITAADKLELFRRYQREFVSLSFPTISSSGPNGAIIHYRPEPGACATIDRNALYLCDSGAQYLDGTTDVTRTVHFGTTTAHERECFTRVLKGHIPFALAVFPTGTPGEAIDAFARQALWQVGLDYRHGTGHGVGSFLCVHEGPQRISHQFSGEPSGLQAGMVVTDEPGYYEDGSFGIRIENVMIVRKAATRFQFGGKDYLEFEPVTLVPMQLSLIDIGLLAPDEIAWLNHYHDTCRHRVRPVLESHGWAEAVAWLDRNTVHVAPAAHPLH